MKRIFTKILLCTTCSTILPITSCHVKPLETKIIEIISSLGDITVMQEEDHLSKPLQAKCFGPDKTERKLDIKFSLQSVGNQELPNWISLTTKNEIKLTGGKNVGSYSFSIVAYNDYEKIYSSSKTFKVNVVEERHIVPDKLNMEVENNKYCMYGEETTMPITITPSKEGIEEKYLLKSCIFKVDVISGLTTDLNNKPLFSISDSNIDPVLKISRATNSGYTMQYRILIRATLIADPSVSTSKVITLNIDNVRYYYDSDTKYTYTRENADQDWTLSLLDSSIQGLTEVKSFIQNKPVTTITQSLCAKSNIKEMVEINLPESITTIEDHAFEGQIYLCSVGIPGVKYVGNNAFYHDGMLELKSDVKQPSFLKVGNRAFADCKRLTLDTLQNVYSIGNFAFINAGLQKFEVGPNCNFLGAECFGLCKSLTQFKILTLEPPKIGGGNFASCSNLTTILVPYRALAAYKSDPDWVGLGKNIEGI